MGRNDFFEVGDLVRIRDWDEMVSEFGIDKDGDIKCVGCFTAGMKNLCGVEFYIESFTEFGGSKLVAGLKGNYVISLDMIEKVEYKKLEETEELNNFLEGYKVV